MYFDNTVHFKNEDVDKLYHAHPGTDEPANHSYYDPRWEFPVENLKFGKLSETTYLHLLTAHILCNINSTHLHYAFS